MLSELLVSRHPGLPETKAPPAGAHGSPYVQQKQPSQHPLPNPPHFFAKNFLDLDARCFLPDSSRCPSAIGVSLPSPGFCENPAEPSGAGFLRENLGGLCGSRFFYLDRMIQVSRFLPRRPYDEASYPPRSNLASRGRSLTSYATDPSSPPGQIPVPGLFSTFSGVWGLLIPSPFSVLFGTATLLGLCPPCDYRPLFFSTLFYLIPLIVVTIFQ